MRTFVLPRLLIWMLMYFLIVSGLVRRADAEDWPNWRGPYQDGSSRETGVPIAWNEHLGVLWKCKLPEWGNNTPSISGDAIFLTSETSSGELLLLRIDKPTGKIVWTQQVGLGTAPRGEFSRKVGNARRHQRFHRDNNLASPSTVTDGETVVCHFGNGDLAAYDFEGNQLWKRNLQEDHGTFSIWWGRANSPVLLGDLVISVSMQDSCSDLPGKPSPSYLVAHNKMTGTQKWFTRRATTATAESCDAYTTPLVRTVDGESELIVWGGQTLDAYQPSTGKRIWWLEGLIGNRVITGPVLANGTFYVTQGMRRALLAIRPNGLGSQTRDSIVWKYDQGTPDSPTPVISGGLLFYITDNGIAKCLDLRAGQLAWKARLQGDYRASPLAAEGRIYFLNVEGRTTVVAASRRFERLTNNQLDDRTYASPIVSDGRLFIRGRKWLYCLGK